jgi:hypothetical protein
MAGESEREDHLGPKTTGSTRRTLLTAVIVTGLCLLHHVANAHMHPPATLEVSLSESEYQANDPVSGEIQVTTSRSLVGLVRLVVIDETTGLRIYRKVFSVQFRRAGTKRFPFTIVPTPAPNDAYRVVATLLTDDFVHHPKRLAEATAEFSVVMADSPVAPLPFWISYCADPTCGGLAPLVVHVCAEDSPSCSPSRLTTIVPRLDGRQIDQILFPIQTPAGATGVTATVISGAGLATGYVASYTSPVILKSDADITLSHYGVSPVWGGTTLLDFVSSTMISPEVVTTVYRHPTFLVNDEVTQLHERGRDVIALESQIAGIDPGQMHAIFMPSEFATLGEGNFSDGNLGIYMNYSNPGFIEAKGSVDAVVIPRFAHEYVHELFSEVASSHPGNNTCLNEGLADAFAFAAGSLPEPDFGPVGVRGTDFSQGCAEIAQNFEIHDAGNCPFWQVHRLGLLSQSFVAAILRPQHVIEFDSCNLTSARTGNALVVLFSAAAGVDMTTAIEMAEIPNAGSFEAAKQALGL